MNRSVLCLKAQCPKFYGRGLPFSMAAVLVMIVLLPALVWGEVHQVALSSVSRLAVPSAVPESNRTKNYTQKFCDGATPTNFLRSANRFWLVLLIPLMVFAFIGIAIAVDGYLIPSLECICESLNLNANVAGATFMAFGSSAPHLMISSMSTFRDQNDVGIGIIAGSTIFNILVVIGICGRLAPDTLDLDFRPVLRDLLFSMAGWIVVFVFVMFSSRGRGNWWEGLILVGGYVLYIIFMMFFNERIVRTPSQEGEMESSKQSSQRDTPGQLAGGEETEVQEETSPDTGTEVRAQDVDLLPQDDHVSAPRTFLGVPLPSTKLGWAAIPLAFPWKLIFRWTIVRCDTEAWKKWWFVTLVCSLIWIVTISFALGEVANLTGCFIGIPGLIMGLTVLAAGTSVPDALASAAVARHGFGVMVVYNALGSNVFNIFLGIGLPWLIGGLAQKAGQEVTVAPDRLMVISIITLLVITVAFPYVLLIFKWKLPRAFGFVLLRAYAVFLSCSLLEGFVLPRIFNADEL